MFINVGTITAAKNESELAGVMNIAPLRKELGVSERSASAYGVSSKTLGSVSRKIPTAARLRKTRYKLLFAAARSRRKLTDAARFRRQQIGDAELGGNV